MSDTGTGCEKENEWKISHISRQEQTLIRTDHAQGDEHCKLGLLLVCEEGKNTRQGGRLTERVIVDVVV